MKYFSLQEYKTIKQRLIYLDILIKNETSNKDMFLQDHFISPTSYRRAKNDGKKIGNQILKDLSSYFNYKIPTDTLIDEIEQRLNEIYFNTVYKKYKSYEEDVKYLDSLILENYIINPIIKVFRLLLEVYKDSSVLNMINDNNDKYIEIKMFDNYYTEDLLKVIEILDLTFIEKLDNNVLSKNYKNPLSFYTLSSKCNLNNLFYESLYFGDIAKKMLIESENYTRVYYLNVILMSSYNRLEYYINAKKISEMQLYSLKDIDDLKSLYSYTNRQYIISLLGLNEYENLFNYLYKKTSLKFYELIALFYCKYKLDSNNYYLFINNYLDINILDDFKKDALLKFHEFIFNKDKKFFEFGGRELPHSFLNVLKKL